MQSLLFNRHLDLRMTQLTVLQIIGHPLFSVWTKWYLLFILEGVMHGLLNRCPCVMLLSLPFIIHSFKSCHSIMIFWQAWTEIVLGWVALKKHFYHFINWLKRAWGIKWHEEHVGIFQAPRYNFFFKYWQNVNWMILFWFFYPTFLIFRNSKKWIKVRHIWYIWHTVKSRALTRVTN